MECTLKSKEGALDHNSGLPDLMTVGVHNGKRNNVPDLKLVRSSADIGSVAVPENAVLGVVEDEVSVVLLDEAVRSNTYKKKIYQG